MTLLKLMRLPRISKFLNTVKIYCNIAQSRRMLNKYYNSLVTMFIIITRIFCLFKSASWGKTLTKSCSCTWAIKMRKIWNFWKKVSIKIISRLFLWRIPEWFISWLNNLTMLQRTTSWLTIPKKYFFISIKIKLLRTVCWRFLEETFWLKYKRWLILVKMKSFINLCNEKYPFSSWKKKTKLIPKWLSIEMKPTSTLIKNWTEDLLSWRNRFKISMTNCEVNRLKKEITKISLNLLIKYKKILKKFRRIIFLTFSSSY